MDTWLNVRSNVSSVDRWKYDVFVSFRGDDIRKSFMDHLFNDFKRKGIRAFTDDRQLPKGEAISPHLYTAIEESRHQTDSYDEAIDKHQRSNRPEVDNRKKALFMAANLSGWDLQDMTDGSEYKFIDCISKYVLKILCDGPFHVGENLVGIDSHLKKLNMLHFVQPDKVNMIGICGISGIGKTTLVKAIYNLMYVHFEGSCFCEDVQGVSKRQGLTQVQMQMIGKIMKTEDMKISNVGEGISVIKKMMSSKILLVLDDVDDQEQLKALASSPDWFCPGSLIILTSKDKQLLRSHKVDRIYEMESLDDYEALELFSLYAFGKRYPTKDFEDVASQIVKYLKGHPLALIVIGRLLTPKENLLRIGKTSVDVMRFHGAKQQHDVLKRTPKENLQPVFDVSIHPLL
ncbi:NB-ARC domains-containing protein, partial [Tanacetum coccineum]